MSKKESASFLSINERIATAIKTDANEGAVSQVVDKRVEAEVTRRVGIIEKAVDKYNATKKELKGCGPDQKSYTVVTDDKKSEVGTPNEHVSYSESQWKRKKALERLIADLDIAVMNAFSDNEENMTKGYTALQKLIGGNGKDKGGKTEESTEE